MNSLNQKCLIILHLKRKEMNKINVSVQCKRKLPLVNFYIVYVIKIP